MNNLVGACISTALLAACGGGNNGASSSMPLSGTPQSFGFKTLGKSAHSLSTVLYTYYFPGLPNGENPAAALLLGSKGTLYGTTSQGGSSKVGVCGSGCGTVFKLAPSGSSYDETVLYRFKGESDGFEPRAALIAGKDGTLYGTTADGGGAKASGTVFKLAPSGSAYIKTILHRFKGKSDGAGPSGGLIIGKGGVLYGTTSDGGATQNGTVYELVPSGTGYTEHVLYSFKGYPDGSGPAAGVITDNEGALYGTTAEGGAYEKGSVFKLTPSGSGYSESILWNLGNGDDGANPAGSLVADKSGALYGTTANGGGGVNCDNGCGTVFKLTPSGSSYAETLLHSFQGGYSDGSLPVAGLALNSAGELFGTTEQGDEGGPSCGCGTVFKLTTLGTGYANWGFGGDGSGLIPLAGVILGKEGAVWGTTFYGEKQISRNYGTVYELKF